MRTTLLAIGCLSVLVGCGGGGGGGGGGGATALSLSISDSTLTVSENSQASLAIDVNKTGATYTLMIPMVGQTTKTNLSDAEPGISWNVEEGRLKVDASNIDKKTRTVLATLTASIGDEKSSATFQLELNNESLDELTAVANVYLKDSQSMSELTEISDVESAYSKVLEFLGHTASTFTPSFDGGQYTSNVTALTTALRNLEGGGSETEVSDAVTTINNQLNAHAAEYVTHINGLASIDNSLKTLPETSLSINGEGHSYFIGNANYGHYDVSNFWQFNAEHQYIGNLINPLYGNCSI